MTIKRLENMTGRDLVGAAVEEARKKGAEAAEAYFGRSEEIVIEVRDGEVENLKIAEESGLGIRILRHDCLGFAYTSDLSRPALIEAVEAALANARVASPDSFNVIPGPPPAYPAIELGDPDLLKSIPLEEKIERARLIEKSGRAFDARVQITEQAAYEESFYQVSIANSRGVSVAEEGSYCGGVASLVAGADGEQQSGFGLQFTRNYAELDPEAIGREAAFRAVRLLGSRRLGTKRAAVVFDPYVVTNFLAVLSQALTAEAVQKGRSLFAGKIGETVAAPAITIIDDGTLPGGLMSAPSDGEGVPSQRTVLIQDGKLLGYLHNSYTGAKDGKPSTGNASRGSYKSPPELGSTNLYLAPGDLRPDDIIKKTENGIYLTDVMGMHTVNPISGDFSVGAAGIWIEHGELTTPVRGMVIAGNILELLAGIDAVGNDLRFFVGRGAPTVRVARLTISGE
jgi:PmbA protein